jgi:hypothetical protein
MKTILKFMSASPMYKNKAAGVQQLYFGQP